MEFSSIWGTTGGSSYRHRPQQLLMGGISHGGPPNSGLFRWHMLGLVSHVAQRSGAFGGGWESAYSSTVPLPFSPPLITLGTAAVTPVTHCPIDLSMPSSGSQCLCVPRGRHPNSVTALCLLFLVSSLACAFLSALICSEYLTHWALFPSEKKGGTGGHWGVAVKSDIICRSLTAAAALGFFPRGLDVFLWWCVC